MISFNIYSFVSIINPILLLEKEQDEPKATDVVPGKARAHIQLCG